MQDRQANRAGLSKELYRPSSRSAGVNADDSPPLSRALSTIERQRGSDFNVNASQNGPALEMHQQLTRIPSEIPPKTLDASRCPRASMDEKKPAFIGEGRALWTFSDVLKQGSGGECEIRTHGRLPVGSFQDCWFKPLTQVSGL